MSTFNETAVDLGGSPTTYGEMRELATEISESAKSDPDGVEFAVEVLRQPQAAVGAFDGLATALLYVLDKLEEAQGERVA